MGSDYLYVNAREGRVFDSPDSKWRKYAEAEEAVRKEEAAPSTTVHENQSRTVKRRERSKRNGSARGRGRRQPLGGGDRDSADLGKGAGGGEFREAGKARGGCAETGVGRIEDSDHVADAASAAAGLDVVELAAFEAGEAACADDDLRSHNGDGASATAVFDVGEGRGGKDSDGGPARRFGDARGQGGGSCDGKVRKRGGAIGCNSDSSPRGSTLVQRNGGGAMGFNRDSESGGSEEHDLMTGPGAAHGVMGEGRGGPRDGGVEVAPAKGKMDRDGGLDAALVTRETVEDA